MYCIFKIARASGVHQTSYEAVKYSFFTTKNHQNSTFDDSGKQTNKFQKMLIFSKTSKKVEKSCIFGFFINHIEKKLC